MLEVLWLTSGVLTKQNGEHATHTILNGHGNTKRLEGLLPTERV